MNVGRPPKALETVALQITVPKILADKLDAVVQTGLYGNSRAACAERLICRGIEALLKEKFIKNETR